MKLYTNDRQIIKVLILTIIAKNWLMYFLRIYSECLRVDLEAVDEVLEQDAAHEEPNDGPEGNHAVHKPDVHARAVPRILKGLT